MPKKRATYVPSMEDAAVKEKTGRDWAGWFARLDEAGAAKLEHKAIGTLLSDKHGVRSWWRQMVAVETERKSWGAAVEKLKAVLVVIPAGPGAAKKSAPTRSSRAAKSGSAGPPGHPIRIRS